MQKQSYRYIKSQSILGSEDDDFILTENEYSTLYSFFVTYSMCKNQSNKSKSFIDYGWPNNNTNYGIVYNELKSILDLNDNQYFVFTESDDLKEQFQKLKLYDGKLRDLEFERGVIGTTKAENIYFKLFYHVRDCFAHGKFSLRFSSNNEKVVVMQDDNSHSVTARIVINLNTLLQFAKRISKK